MQMLFGFDVSLYVFKQQVKLEANRIKIPARFH